MIYITEDGSRILPVSDVDIAMLEWDERVLLELEHDGVSWNIQQSSCMTGKVVAD